MIHFGISWWFTLFLAADGIPYSIAVRILDILLFEGIHILFRVGLNFLKLKESELLSVNGMENLLLSLRRGLRDTIYEEDNDLFFRLMFGINITKADLKVMRNEAV